MNERDFQTVLELAKSAGHRGDAMPRFGDISGLTKVQMGVLNRMYDEARNAHAGKKLSRRRS